MKKPTIHDVAHAAGVSPATVSRVINGDPSVGPSYREKVEAAVALLSFRPQLSARAIRGGHTGLLGMLLPRLDLDTFTGMADGAMREAAALGCGIVLMNSEGSSSVEQERLLQLSRMPIDGLIFRPVSRYTSFEQAQSLTGIPVVGLSVPSGPASVPGIPVAAEHSAYIAAKYLLRIGRRRIAITVSFREMAISSVEELERMTPESCAPIGVQRYKGYRRALEEAQIPFDPSLILFHGYTKEGGHAAAAQLLSMDIPADALICANDEAALGALTFLREQGVTVPQQISLIGFDDSAICRATSPTLTSVNFHSVDVGRQAVRILRALIAGQQPDPNDFVCRASLVIRGSTCAPVRPKGR
ncbi:MAG: LacI family DNA-binding transcriptional regulator [Clostridia bacterium]|nr:LacI family DNA-binding transcriptional regulator [Clostridia bacterium]